MQYEYDVKKFGAIGDGVSDDTDKIQAALEVAQKNNGGIVFFPIGRYKVSSTINITGCNIQLVGSGHGSVIFLDKENGTVIKVGHSTDMNQTMHNKIKNLVIDRSEIPEFDSCGIWIDRARYTDVDEVTIYNSGCGISVGPKGEDGIPNQFTSITNSRLLQGTFPDAGIIFYSGADYKVSKVFIEPGNRGIVMSGKSNAITIDQTSIINGGAYQYGIVSEGTGFARYVTNCIIENALHQQVFIGGSSERFTLTNSWLGAGDTNGDTRIGIQIEPGAKSITISNNRIGDQRKMGILSRGDDVIIQGNTLEGNVNGNYNCDSLQVEGGKHVIISGNRISSVSDRFGAGLYDHESNILNYFIFTNNDTSETGNGYIISASGKHKIDSNNL
ncbi:glycosyl hydrolase family 28-related protein [Paenibacillus sp. UMB7766-LJ446]|uniref:glycosyl hydrolase family 28-related protein n=1 Tax=Paenibacillus sp. UMB7766-LJ446 TaxID=3046313 RepID=UPI00254D0154|nr:glycosyl hydrolase family 28-related protein [Paenibacillus sp. UMB7766-LJ446]MDK8193098.1 glycosyl hydrolase family 28-related protein [Paenibacillus sp. UMB7766-LJ446]